MVLLLFLLSESHYHLISFSQKNWDYIKKPINSIKNMKNIIRHIRKSIEYVKDEVNSIHKKQTEFLVKSQLSKSQPKNIKLGINEYPELDKFFVRFFNSKPIEGRVSNKSLAFVIGPQKVGKTQFIEKNLNLIRKRKNQLKNPYNTQKYPQFGAAKSPQSYENEIQQSVFDNSLSIIIKKDYNLQGTRLNFTNFIEDLHDQILQNIQELLIRFELQNKNAVKYSSIQKNNSKSNSSQQKYLSLLTPQIIKQIVIHEYAPEYIFIHIKDVIFAIIQQKDSIRLSKQFRDMLQNWNDQNIYGGACTWEHFYQKLYHPLIEILSNALKQQNSKLKVTEQIQKSQIAIKLFYSVFKRIEYENRPQQYINCWYQTGIQTTNFLFDLLNFLSGTGKYIDTLQKNYTKAQVNSERQEAKIFLQNSNNFILLGNHVDIMLCLVNLEDLMCFQNKSKPFLDFFDHVICRTTNQSNFRKHFPILIEMPNRTFLDDTLQLGKIDGSNPVIIQIPGYIQSYLKFTNVIEIFQQKKLFKMFHNFGRNPHTWKSMIQAMAQGISMNDIQDGKAPYQLKQKIIAEAKMNRVYTSARCLQYLDNQSLDFEIRQTLDIFSKINGMGRSTTSFLGVVLYNQPYFTSMMEQNIFYHMYYMAYVDYAVSLPAYLSFYRDQYLKNLKRNNSWLEYKLWRSKNKEYALMKLDMKYKSVHEKIFLEGEAFGKEHVDFEFWTTYYSPIKDYGIQYYSNAYAVRNFA